MRLRWTSFVSAESVTRHRPPQPYIVQCIESDTHDKIQAVVPIEHGLARGRRKGALSHPDSFDSSSNSVIERQNTTYIERLTKPKTLDLYLGAREQQR